MDLSGSWEYIQRVARSRLEHNKTPHHEYRYGEGIEVIGVAGEIVTRRFLGLSEEVHDGFDHGVDLEFAGFTMDVKATILTPKLEFRFLQWPVGKKVKAEIIVMTAIDPIHKVGTIVGYATRNEIEAAPVNTTRPVPCHEIPVPSLHPMWLMASIAVGRYERDCLPKTFSNN